MRVCLRGNTMPVQHLLRTFPRLLIALSWLCLAGSHGLAAAPTISSFSPASGSIDTLVTINGSEFTGATAVRFHGAPAPTFTVVSNTKITARAPTTVTTGTLSVATSGGTGTSSASFRVIPGAKVGSGTGRPLVNAVVYGAGFTRSRATDIYFDTTDLALAASS